MSHPYEQLADLLDGTLDADARASVDAHLATCDACRADLEAAATGRAHARALAPVEPPPDLRDRTLAALGGGGGGPRWYRWAGVAAAALIVGVIAVSLPEVGDTGGSTAEAPASAEATLGADAGGPRALEVSDRDYRGSDLTRLAQTAARDSATLNAVATPALDAGPAADCVRRAFEEQPTGTLVRLIRARFEGTPAYVAVYLEGPGAGEEPDTAVVWVASAETCEVLSFAQARI